MGQDRGSGRSLTSMTGFDFPTDHFRLMEKVAHFLKEINAQLLTSEYHYESFGSWWFTFRKSGNTYQIVYDGRDSRLSFESDPTATKRHGVHLTDWTELDALVVCEMKDIELDILIEQLIRRGISNAEEV